MPTPLPPPTTALSSLAPGGGGDTAEEASLSGRNAFGRGDHWSLSFGGLTVVRRRYEMARDAERQVVHETPFLTLRFCVQGDVEAHLPDGLLHTRAGEHALVYAPEPTYRHVLRRDTANDLVEVHLTPSYVTALVERYPELLEAGLAPVVRDEPFRLCSDGLPLTAPLRRAVRSVLDSGAAGPLRRMVVEANALELLALQLQQGGRRAGTAPGAVALSDREVDRMVEARDRLLDRIDDPPSLAELARLVGTNEFALKRDFKAAFGTTVYGLLLDHKLEHARALLLDTDRAVGEIAREVGYRHPAHFSTAFKKKYGVPPSSLRC
jgi:AraC-like DNA-binding protein